MQSKVPFLTLLIEPFFAFSINIKILDAQKLSKAEKKCIFAFSYNNKKIAQYTKNKQIMSKILNILKRGIYALN